MNLKSNKYVTIFDYINKILIVLSATTSGVSIISFTSGIGTSVGIGSASLTLFFFSNDRNSYKITKYNKKHKEKASKTLILAKSKLNSIETLTSQALIDMNISHKEIVTILKKKDKYEKMKDNFRSENEEYKITRLSSMKSKI